MKLPVLLLLLAGPVTAPAVVIHSGLINIPIPFTMEGVTVDIDAVGTVPDEALGWDVNFFYSGFAIAGSVDFQPVRTGTGNEDPVRRFDEGALIVATLPYSAGETGSFTHLGAPDNFEEGESGYLGFRFSRNGDSTPLYGWMRVTLTANSTPGIIHEWAWETSGGGIATGQIPEPSAAVFAFTGMMLALCRRSRSATR